MKDRGFLKASGIIEIILGILGILASILLIGAGVLVFSIFDTIIASAPDTTWYPLAQSLKSLMDIVGGLTKFILLISGGVALAISIMSIIFGSKCNKYSKLESVDFRKKRKHIITFIVIEIILSILTLASVILDYNLSSLISALIYLILIPGFKIIQLIISRNEIKNVKEVIDDKKPKTESVESVIENNIEATNENVTQILAMPIVNEPVLEQASLSSKEETKEDKIDNINIDSIDDIFSEEANESLKEEQKEDIKEPLMQDEIKQVQINEIKEVPVLEDEEEQTIEEQVDKIAENLPPRPPLPPRPIEPKPPVEEAQAIQNNTVKESFDYLTELERLSNLRDKGVINQVEFLKLKSDLLNKMKK